MKEFLKNLVKKKVLVQAPKTIIPKIGRLPDNRNVFSLICQQGSRWSELADFVTGADSPPSYRQHLLAVLSQSAGVEGTLRGSPSHRH